METPNKPTTDFEKVVALLCLFVLLFAVACVATHSSAIANRYRDAWWHIAVADEYQKTGVFAKDPFYPDAPPFVQFGLMEVACARLSSLTGWSARESFLCAYVLNTLMLATGGFLGGYLLFRSVTAGLVSSVATSLFLVIEWPFASGFPFATAVALLGFFAASLWTWRCPVLRHPRSGTHAEENPVRTLPYYWGGVWRGIALGLIFDLHVFAGVFGGLLVGCTAFADLLRCLARRDWQRLQAMLVGYAVLGGGFVAVAWRWVSLQWQVRPYLDNPHKLLRMASLPEYLRAMFVGAALLFLHVVSGRLSRRPLLLPTRYLWLALVVLILAMPFGRQIVGGCLMPHLADRVPLFFPFGAICAAVYVQCAGLLRGDAKCRNMGVCLLALALLAASPVIYRRGRFCVNMLRRMKTEYTQHPYAFLTTDLAAGWQGKVILSDPYTSFFARGLVGPYVVGTVIGQSSEAVDDVARDAVARRALLQGPAQLGGLHIDAVVVEKGSRDFLQDDPFTRTFATISPEQLIDVWTNGGWQIRRETRHLFLLCPPAP